MSIEPQPKPQLPEKPAAAVVEKKTVSQQANDLWDKVQIAVGIAAVVSFIFFLIQNWEDVEVDALLWDGTVPLSLVMLASFLLGAATAGGILGYRNLRKSEVD